MGKVILAASGKGGAGKSMFTINLGATFADRGLKVVILDMNIGLRNLDIYLGLESKVIYDIADVISGVCKPRRALVKDKRFDSLFLMSSPQSWEKFIADDQDMMNLYAELKSSYDFILVDGPSGIGHDLLLAATSVDLAVIVSTLEQVALRNADMTSRVLLKHGVSKMGFVLNKVSSEELRDGLPSLEDASKMIDLRLLGIIQQDHNIHLAINSGIPIVYQKGSYIEHNFNKIADRLIEL